MSSSIIISEYDSNTINSEIRPFPDLRLLPERTLAYEYKFYRLT